MNFAQISRPAPLFFAKEEKKFSKGRKKFKKLLTNGFSCGIIYAVIKRSSASTLPQCALG